MFQFVIIYYCFVESINPYTYYLFFAVNSLVVDVVFFFFYFHSECILYYYYYYYYNIVYLLFPFIHSFSYFTKSSISFHYAVIDSVLNVFFIHIDYPLYSFLFAVLIELFSISIRFHRIYNYRTLNIKTISVNTVDSVIFTCAKTFILDF